MTEKTRTIEPYRPRAVVDLGLWDIEPLRLKVYGIRYDGDTIDDALVTAARTVVEARVAESAPRTLHHGLGFAGVHQGKTAHFVFVDWWAEENEIHHHVYVSSLESPEELIYATPTGISACTWDLRVIGFERDAWVEHMMNASAPPDPEGYLAARCPGPV